MTAPTTAGQLESKGNGLNCSIDQSTNHKFNGEKYTGKEKGIKFLQLFCLYFFI